MIAHVIIQMLEVILIGIIIIICFILIKKLKKPQQKQITVLLGSGGHTGEMVDLLHNFHFNSANKINFIITSTDKSSENFVLKALENRNSKELFQSITKKIKFIKVKRTNQVKQSFITSLFTTFLSLLDCFKLILGPLRSTSHFISNGPGTCVPFNYSFFLFTLAGICQTKLIFIQSWCRVTDLSFSGKLVRPIVDDFIVHWPQLAEKYKKCKYMGQII